MSNKKSYDSDQKDYIISKLKGELYEYHSQQPDFGGLKGKLDRLENNYLLVQEEIAHLAKERRVEEEQDIIQIQGLRKQADTLRQEYQRFQKPMDNRFLQEQIKMNSLEIERLRGELEIISGNELDLKQERGKLEKQIQQLREEHDRLDEGNNRLMSEIEEQYGKNNKLAERYKELELEQNRNEKIMQQQRKELEIGKSKKDLMEHKLEQWKLQEDQLKEQLEEEYQHQKVLVQEGEQIQQQQESLRNTNLEEQQRELERDIRQQDQQGELLMNQFDEQQLKKLNIIEDSKFLNVEISRALDIINQLSVIKDDLVKEMQNFMNEDEQANKLIQRGERQKSKLQQNIDLINESLQNISQFLR